MSKYRFSPRFRRGVAKATWVELSACESAGPLRELPLRLIIKARYKLYVVITYFLFIDCLQSVFWIGVFGFFFNNKQTNKEINKEGSMQR